MIAIHCPNCREAMQVEEAEANTEWECPSCSAAFVIRSVSGGVFEYALIDDGSQKRASEPLPNVDITKPTVAKDPAIPEEAYLYALEHLLKGVKQREIRKSLVQSGYTSRQVEQILKTALRFQKENEAKERAMPGSNGNTGQTNMVIGALVCVAGIVVTLSTLSLATTGGSGTYVIAWGAVIFGAGQFMRGFVQSRNS